MNKSRFFLSMESSSVQRAVRLLESAEELERAVLNSYVICEAARFYTLQKGDCREWSEVRWQRSLDSAKKMEAEESDRTKEFRLARKYGLTDPISGWKRYKRLCQLRSVWGEYLRSDLNWDWDPSGSLKHLFRLPPGYAPSRKKDIVLLTVIVGDQAAQDGVLDVSIGRSSGEPIRKVRVKYETETGETRYRTFLHCSSLEDASLDNCRIKHDHGNGGHLKVEEVHCSNGGSEEET